MNKQAFARLVQAAQLQNVSLLETAAKASFPDSGSQPGELSADFDVSAIGTIIGADDLSMMACEVALVFKGTVGEHPLCTVTAKYGVAYTLTPGYVEEEGAVQFFADNNALFNVWPFFREHLWSLTQKMGMPPFVLPLLHPRVEEITAGDSAGLRPVVQGD